MFGGSGTSGGAAKIHAWGISGVEKRPRLHRALVRYWEEREARKERRRRLIKKGQRPSTLDSLWTDLRARRGTLRRNASACRPNLSDAPEVEVVMIIRGLPGRVCRR